MSTPDRDGRRRSNRRQFSRRWLWLLLVIAAAAGAWLWQRNVERPRYMTVQAAIQAGDLEDVRYHIERGTQIDKLDETGYSYLHIAALEGRPEIAGLLISEGLDPESRDPSRTLGNYTPLHLAARENNVEVALTLLKAGADPNARDARERTPLHLAALADSAETARVLLEHDADANARDEDGATPLATAVKWNNEDVGKALVQFGGVK